LSISLGGTLVLLGAGKMGGAMLEGWLKAGVEGHRIAVLDPMPSEAMKALVNTAGARLNPPVSAIADAEVLVIAVKPQLMEEAVPALAPLGRQRPLILSVVAGKTIASFARHFGETAAIIRSIPNTPAAIGRGITAMAANSHVASAQLQLARQLLSAIGEVVEVSDESQIDLVTAVSGSGPAYIFYVTECLTAAAAKLGLPAEIAKQLARATVAGAGELMRVTGEEAATLRQNVTSPKGTTYAALQVLMADDGLQPLFDKAVEAAAKRSRELAG
jgi:pyrroline-5-carboxylate reductase